MTIKDIKAPSTRPVSCIRELPLIGSRHDFRHDRLNFLLRVAQEGSMYGFHVGPQLIVLVSKPAYAQSILVDHAADFSRRRHLRKAIVGNGLLISEGEYHNRQRKLIAPHFQPRHLAGYADNITQYGELFQLQLSDGQVIDLRKEMMHLVTKIVVKVLFGIDYPRIDELMSAIGVTFAHTTYVLSTPFVPPPNWPTPHNQRVREARRWIQNFLHDIIAEKYSGTAGHTDILSQLLQAKYDDGSTMSERQVMTECWTLLTAGYETTAVALIWTWYLLCQHPEIYQKMQHEVDGVLEGRTPTYDDLPHLPYCLQIFKEAMRLYPPAPAIGREAVRNVEIGEYLLPKGTNLLISSYVMHRQQQYFPHPEQFDPDRFLPEREKEIPRYAYLPFGGGSRICIGNHFSLLEGHLLLATLAQRLTFTLKSPLNIQFDVEGTLTLRPKGEVAVIVKKR